MDPTTSSTCETRAADAPSAPAPTGRAHWRSVEELQQTPEFRSFLDREFPEGASEASEEDRRQFIKVMGASFALAGVASSGCLRWPETKIVPAARGQENRVAGHPVAFATCLQVDGVAVPAMATSYEGRPIKLDGNERHPSASGGSSAMTQARILELYDPDRLRATTQKGAPSSLPEFDGWWATHANALRAKQGAGLAILSEAIGGEVHTRAIELVSKAFPKARVYVHAPAAQLHEQAGTAIAFGAAKRVLPDFGKAKVVVSFGSDFLVDHPASVRFAGDYAKGRRLDSTDPKQQQITRLYCVESRLSLTGMNADERIAVKPSQVQAIAAMVADRLGAVPGCATAADAKLDEQATKVVDALLKDLKEAGARALVVAGPTQPAAVHAIACAINQKLGGAGTTVTYIPAPAAAPGIAEFARDAASIDTLVVLGGNPAYDAPASLGVAGLIAKIPNVVRLAYRNDESSVACAHGWVIASAHPLECWGDGAAWDGTLSIQQPLIMPMMGAGAGGLSAVELLLRVAGHEPRTGYDFTRQVFARKSGLAGADFEVAWRAALSEGWWPGTNAKSQSALAVDAAKVAASPVSAAGDVELCLFFDSKVHDGRFANLGWMQELPDVVTKITWDNALLMSPAMATSMGLKAASMVRVKTSAGSVVAAVWVLPGHAEGCVSLALGYGRTAAAGRLAEGCGFDGYAAMVPGAFSCACELTKETGTYEFAHTQDHGAINPFDATVSALKPNVPADGAAERLGGLVREATLGEYRDHPDFAKHRVHVVHRLSLWEESNLDGAKFRWAMSVDLGTCTGCSACVTACQAENNIPIVGKAMVKRGREMHWMRIDRYFKGPQGSPTGYAVQPVTCMQCENAPCEQVCPVAATVHDEDGLNSMVYNRCIGTRYCSNNCPYKVRRFNFFNYHKRTPDRQEGILKTQPEYYISEGPDRWLQLQFNPDVTVRIRGVMEKCTFCVQRINRARIESKNEWARKGGSAGSPDWKVADGAIVTACQQACPSGAIVFGDLNDPNSKVSRLHRQPTSYQMLEELNTKTRLRYVARVTNPAIERPAADDGHGHGTHGHDAHDKEQS
ncbi:MAG: Tetrathionate reductase subunit precursor [Planctomycetota bacterium]|jgi:molybdopterin-containing oxidoreductase family iron-sulfur binding subunit